MTNTGYSGGPPVRTPGGDAGGDEGGSKLDTAKEVATTVSEQGKEVASTAATAARDVAEEVKAQGSQVLQEAKAQTRDLAHEARQQLRQHADDQAQRAADGLYGVGDQITALREGRPEDAGATGQYLGQLGEKVTGMADRIQERGIDGVIDDVQRFARRRPGVFLLGAAAAGFAVGRLLRGAQAASNGDGVDLREGAGGPSGAAASGQGDSLPPIVEHPAAGAMPATGVPSAPLGPAPVGDFGASDVGRRGL